MAATLLGNALSNVGILRFSDAEEAFTPWWEVLQTYLCYGIIIFGIFGFTAVNENVSCANLSDIGTSLPLQYINKYCSRERIPYSPLLVRSLPSSIASAACILLLVNAFAYRLTLTRAKLGKFYVLLAREVIVGKGAGHSSAAANGLDGRDNLVTLEAVRNEFRRSRSLRTTFALNCVAKFLVSLTYCFLVPWISYGALFTCQDQGLQDPSASVRGNLTTLSRRCFIIQQVQCTVANIEFSCVVDNVEFHTYLVLIFVILNSLYLITTSYSLAWLAFKRLRPLGSLLSNCYSLSSNPVDFVKNLGNGNKQNSEQPTLSPDVELMINLLAETNGLAVAVRILSHFDPSFKDLWKVREFHWSPPDVTPDLPGGGSVEFRGAPVVDLLPEWMKKLSIVYTSSVEQLPYNHGCHHHQKQKATTGAETLTGQQPRPTWSDLYSVELQDEVWDGVINRIVVSTVLEGKEVAKADHIVCLRPKRPQEASSSPVEWHFCLPSSGRSLGYRLRLRWRPPYPETVEEWCDSGKLSYLIEIVHQGNRNDPLVPAVNQTSTEFSHLFFDEDLNSKFWLKSSSAGSSNQVVAKVWSVFEFKDPKVGPGVAQRGNLKVLQLKSAVPLVLKIPPVPEAMRELASEMRTRVHGDSDSAHDDDLGQVFFRRRIIDLASEDLKSLYKNLLGIESDFNSP